MTSTREIRSKIRNVENTRQVTRALQMVAASRIRKAQALMDTSRPYALHMRRVVAHIAQANTDYRHPALKDRPVRRVCYMVVSSDRGLCGGLNANLFRDVLQDIHGWQRNGAGIVLVAIGQQAAQFFRRVEMDVVGTVTHLGDHPRMEDLVGVMKIARDAFMRGEVDRICLCYNQFISPMRQRALIDTLIPLAAAARQIEQTQGDDLHPQPGTARIERTTAWDYLYEPEAEPVIRHVLHRYFEAMVYHATLENLASEHAARMIAMKAASDHATRTIGKLTLTYHKVRQAAITREISEIASGAEAVDG